MDAAADKPRKMGLHKQTARSNVHVAISAATKRFAASCHKAAAAAVAILAKGAAKKKCGRRARSTHADNTELRAAKDVE